MSMACRMNQFVLQDDFIFNVFVVLVVKQACEVGLDLVVAATCGSNFRGIPAVVYLK